jgi:DNA modification methylase
MKTETVKLSKLKANPSNPRVLRDDKFAKLKKSITDFPDMLNYRAIVAVTDKDGKLMVLGGNMRLRALQELGIKEAPVMLADHWNEEQRREFIIKDNVGFGEWDWDQLGNEWDAGELSEWGLDLPVDFGAETNEGLTDPDEVPEVPANPVTVLGDVWVLGKHRVMCGSATEVDAIKMLMMGVEPDLIHTDPPYGMNAVSKSGVLSKSYGSDILGDDNTDVAKDAFALIHSLYPTAKHIWWGANYYASALPDSECWLVWDKDNGQSDQTDCELAWANFRSVVRQFTMASEKTNRVHPTQKPVALMEWIIKRFKLTSTTIADYFGGSGSTLIAAEKNGIFGYIMELDPRFVDVIVKRWQDFTGQQAIHEAMGRTFNDMLAQKQNSVETA